MNREGPFVTRIRAHELRVEPGRIRGRPELDIDVLVAIVALVARFPGDVGDDGVAIGSWAAFHGLELRCPLAEALQRLIDGLLFESRRSLSQLDRGQVARIESGHGLDGGRKPQRLALVQRDVLDVRGIDRLNAPLLQRVVDGARNQAVHDVVENLIAEALFDDRRRHLAGPEARDPRLLRVALGDAVISASTTSLGISIAIVLWVSLMSVSSVFIEGLGLWVQTLSS